METSKHVYMFLNLAVLNDYINKLGQKRIFKVYFRSFSVCIDWFIDIHLNVTRNDYLDEIKTRNFLTEIFVLDAMLKRRGENDRLYDKTTNCHAHVNLNFSIKSPGRCRVSQTKWIVELILANHCTINLINLNSLDWLG